MQPRSRAPQPITWTQTLGARIAVVLTLAVVYIGAGKLGLLLAFLHPSSTPVWAPTGIAVAAVLMFGYRVWPGIFLGAFLVNVTTLGTAWTSLGIATGNTLEALVGAYLVLRFANSTKAFETAGNTFKFAIYSGLISTMIAATIGVTTLSLAGFAPWAEYRDVWLTWWLGDAVGAMLVAPLIILWVADFHIRWNWAELGEFAAAIASLAVVSQFVFGPYAFAGARNYPLEYLCPPFLIWIAFRFSQREAITAAVVLCGSAIWGTLHGYGPFAVGTRNESLLLLQSFMGVVGIMSLALAALSVERRRMEQDAIVLATTDSLTGLANYRRLVDVLDLEISRSERTDREFALLLFDLDGLKVVNDHHGHPVGNRAICRLAEILLVHCRNIDTAARYGGDEFALVLPESTLDIARSVAVRICERVASNKEYPPLSVSVGVAMFPENGKTSESLLTAADNALYEMKRRTETGASRIPS